MGTLLVAFAGFGGAGKTTAIQYLEEQGLGRRVYLGQCVLDEIDRRRIKRSPAVEREVRLELRARFGPGVFADRMAPHVTSHLADTGCVFADAIFNMDEYLRLRSCGQQESVLIGIDASFEIRAKRLISRGDGVYTPDELRKRDQIEREDLGTLAVLKNADFTLNNERSFDNLYEDLNVLWGELSV